MNKYRFDETKHEYWNGKIKLLSVNQIIDLAGWEYKFSNTQAMEKGKLVHKTIELAEKGTLNMDTLDPVLAVYLLAYEKLKDELDFEVLGTEMRMYSKQYPIAGTLDILANYKGKKTIIDLKTGQPNPKRERLQTAGYMMLANETMKQHVEQRLILYLTTEKYCELPDSSYDIDIFRACIKLAFYKIS